MNTPRVVMQETKKAFRKLQKTGDVQSAVNALCNLKGVGPGLASGEPQTFLIGGRASPKSIQQNHTKREIFFITPRNFYSVENFFHN